MDKPTAGKYFKSKSDYWTALDRLKAQTGALPPWAFHFISVHPPVPGFRRDAYSLISPLQLVDMVTGCRPVWERERFKFKAAAIRRAQELAAAAGCFVVYCEG